MVPAYFVAANTIRKTAHVRTLLALVIICAGFNALDGVFRRFVIIPSGALGSAQEGWFVHECLVIWGLVLILVVAHQVFGAPVWQRIAGVLLGPAALIAMMGSERRAGLIGFMIAFALFALALIRINRRAFLLVTVPSLVAAAIYLPLFWNSAGTLGQPARAIRSVTSGADARDAASNLWRDLEAFNVRATILSDPLLGIGFGRPFLQIITVPDISGAFEFWDYEAHHNILWVWLKTGAVGFTAFMALIVGAIARAIWLARTLRDRDLRTFALVGLAAVVMAVVFCYVDLGLTNNRITMLLGATLGVLSVLDRVRD
jgi:hypothetical protein